MKRYDKYKDSGCQQIGRIPDKWESVKMKYRFIQRSDKGHPNEPILCATQSSGVIPQSMYENRVVVVNKGFEGLKLVKKGDFVISLRSFQGGLEYAHYQGIISAAYTILQPKEKEFANFYKYLFKSHPFIQLLQTCVTGIREGQNINYALLGKNFIPIPPQATQEKIVAFLDSKTLKIDKCICLRERELQTLNELKQSQIASVVTRGLNPNVPMKDSGIPWIGQIPAHWAVVPFKSQFTLGKGLPITKADLKENGVPVISYGQIHSKQNTFSHITPELYRYVSESFLQSNPQSLVNCGDFLIADTSEDVEGSGNFVVVDKPQVLFAGYHTIIGRSKQPENAPYFSYLFQSSKWRAQIWVQVHGVKLYSISRSILNSTKLVVPPINEQKDIVSYIEDKTNKIDSMISSLNAEIERLKEYKQSLISDVVTGQINVQDEII